MSAVETWDAQRYIDIDEIHRGMEATCLTVYSGTEIERFALKVVSVVRDIQPGRNAILVEGLDERFRHTGPVAGCSGSPVYIEGRLAGALAFGWPLSKDPLYGVTPIREMLDVREGETDQTSTAVTAGERFTWDYSEPLDMAALTDRVWPPVFAENHNIGQVRAWSCPLLVSGLNDAALPLLVDVFQPYGWMAVPGAGASTASKATTLEPGGTMMVPLVDGDIRLAVLGTVTEVVDGRVYGFGHSFLGQGPVDLPLATGEIHTVVSNLSKSFKLGSVVHTVGRLVRDEPAAVLGLLGETAATVPLHLEVQHFNRTEPQTFECRIVTHRMLVADLIKAVILGAAQGYGSFPADHSSAYEVTIRLAHGRTIQFANVSVNDGLREMLGEALGSMLLLLFNPYEQVDIAGIDVRLRLEARNRISYITALEAPDVTVEPGATLSIRTLLESYRAEKRQVDFKLTIPRDMEPGQYRLTVCGPYAYQQYLRRRASYRLMARDIPSLLTALDYVLAVKRDRLYCVLDQPTAGIAVEGSELPHFPKSKAIVLRGAKRTVDLAPYQPWLEISQQIDAVAANQQSVMITVESPHEGGRGSSRR